MSKTGCSLSRAAEQEFGGGIGNIPGEKIAASLATFSALRLRALRYRWAQHVARIVGLALEGAAGSVSAGVGQT